MSNKTVQNVCGVLVDTSIVSRAVDLAVLPQNTAFSYAVFPGFCDVHVHFREPGFSKKP